MTATSVVFITVVFNTVVFIAVVFITDVFITVELVVVFIIIIIIIIVFCIVDVFIILSLLSAHVKVLTIRKRRVANKRGIRSQCQTQMTNFNDVIMNKHMHFSSVLIRPETCGLAGAVIEKSTGAFGQKW